jgi:hypothetical protein
MYTPEFVIPAVIQYEVDLRIAAGHLGKKMIAAVLIYHNESNWTWVITRTFDDEQARDWYLYAKRNTKQKVAVFDVITGMGIEIPVLCETFSNFKYQEYLK